MPALALVALVLALYAPSFGAGFIWDDDTFVTHNRLIHASDGLWRLWFTREAPDYWPLTSSLLWLEWRLWGGAASGFHAVNVALHALSCVLLWRIFARLELPGAWLGAALFAAHPVCVESVSWITERKNTLSFALCAASALLYLRAEDGPQSGRLRWSSFGVFVLSLLAKTSSVVLPPMLLVLAWWRRRRIGRADVLRAAPHFAAAALLGAVTVWFQSTNAIRESVIRDDGLGSRLLTAGRAVWFYLGKALAPLELCFVYPRWSLDESSATSLLPAAMLAFAFAAAWLARESLGRGPLAALSCYVIALAPTLGLIDVYFMRYSLVADHWQYFALPALCALAAAALVSGARRIGVARAATPVALLALCALGAKSWSHQAVFRDLESLWTDTLAKNPQAWMAHNNLGLVRHSQRRFDEALEHFQAALRVEQDLPAVRYNLGVTLQSLRRHADAVTQFEIALELDPRQAAARSALGTSKLALGRFDEAVEDYRAALQLDPELLAAHNNLGNAMYSRERYADALEHYARALELRPDYVEALANQGSALQALGRHEEAIANHSRVVALEPRRAEAHFNLGNALRESGRLAEAAAAYERALALEPRLEGARYFLGEVRERLAREAQAR